GIGGEEPCAGVGLAADTKAQEMSGAGGLRGAAAGAVACGRDLAGGAVEVDGAFVFAIDLENDSTTIGWFAVTVERDGGCARETGGDSWNHVRRFAQVDSIRLAGAIEVFETGAGGVGCAAERESLAGTGEASGVAGELEVGLHAPGGGLDALEHERIEKCRRG